MTASNQKHYTEPSDFLQQGDIFRIDVVSPMVDHRQRLFRAKDGRHGSVVFEEGMDGTLFDPQDLEDLLRRVDRGALHTDPFHPTQDGQPELVVVHAKLVHFFVIATQTCDVSDKDKRAFQAVIILSALTLMDMCRLEPLPFRPGSKGPDITLTIHEYLLEQTGDTRLAQSLDPYEYGTVLRQVLHSWKPPAKPARTNRARINNFLNRMFANGGFVYSVQKDATLGIPELCIDFSAAYTVATERLNQLADRRVARLADPYRDDFAHKFAERISRIAVPTSTKPPRF